jgi:hypothetical protein
MSATMTDLTGRLQANVPARDGMPTSEQYERAIRDSVEGLNNRLRKRKITTLAIVAGQASYALPEDFVTLIQLESAISQGGVILSASGIIPTSARMREETWTISNGQITFYPTPGYTMQRTLEYGAGHVLSDTTYAEMDAGEARLVVMYAEAICLTWQANNASAKAFQYQLGDERVSKERLAEQLREQARDLRQQYEKALADRIGPLVM